MSNTKAFTVEVELPRGVTIARMRQYIEFEIKANVGHYPPDDPLWSLDRNSVKVYPRRKKSIVP